MEGPTARGVEHLRGAPAEGQWGTCGPDVAAATALDLVRQHPWPSVASAKDFEDHAYYVVGLVVG